MKNLLLFIFISSLASCDGLKDYREAAKRSFPAADLVMIPHKFNILDTEWISQKELSTQKGRKKYYGHTTHFTAYDYDTEIPLFFYGKWFEKGEYSPTVYQQHIAGILSSVLNITPPADAVRDVPDILRTMPEKPEIIVTVIIDQGGDRIFKLHPGSLRNMLGLKASSAWFANARVGHLNAHTASGHAAIGTGAFPLHSHVYSNSVFRKTAGKIEEIKIYQTENGINPSFLKSPALADILDIQNRNQSIIISQSYAPRASVGLAGHGSLYKDADRDFVYWLSKSQGKWETNQQYYALPGIADRYDVLQNFNNAYPNGFRGLQPKSKDDLKPKWSHYMATPAEIKNEVSFFLDVIQTEIIDKKKQNDTFTDLAYITIKGTDAAGHLYGQESDEMKQTLAEADVQVGRILSFLKEKYQDRFALVLTADHGCAPLTELSGGAKLSITSLFQAVDSLLPDGTTESLISNMSQSHLELDKDVMKKHGVTKEMIRKKLMQIPGVNGLSFFREVY